MRTRLLGLLASLTLLGLVAGLPMVLLTIAGNPVPSSIPRLDQVWTALSTPDDGTILLGLVTWVAWIAWAVLTVSVLLEVASRLRGVRAPHLPGLSLPQGAAAQLVTAAALLFVAVPAGTGAAPAAAAPPPGTTLAVTAPAVPASTAGLATAHTITTTATARSQHNAPVEDRTVTVHEGDSLWGIAERELGDGMLYKALYRATRHVTQPDGRRLTDPDLIYVGWRIHIPAALDPATANEPEIGTPSARSTAQTPGTPPLVGTSTTDPGAAASTAARPVNPGLRGDRPEDTPEPAQQGSPSAAVTPSATPTASAAPDGAGSVSPSASTGDPAGAAPPHTRGTVPAGASLATPVEGQDAQPAPWMLAGLTAGGALLAGALLLTLRRRRQAQFRHRRPGRTLAAPPPLLAPVEKTIAIVGQVSAPTLGHLDQVLRRLGGATARDGDMMPLLAAVELTATHIVLHLSAPADLTEPWEPVGSDAMHWRITPATPLDAIGPAETDQPAPYPLLVTIGVSDTDAVWLLNIEDLAVTIAGDATYGVDFARYLAAEVACNPWASAVEVSCVGVAAELAAMAPERIHVYSSNGADEDPVGRTLAAAVATIDHARAVGADVATARATQAGDEAWPSRLLLADADASDSPTMEHLLRVVREHAGETATSVVVSGQPSISGGMVLEVTADGRLRLPEVGLDLEAVGLTADEARGCATLLAHADTAITPVDVPVDETAVTGWASYADQAGALRPEHTLPRTPVDAATTASAAVESSSLLDADDGTYTGAAATTTEDLQAVAPRVSATLRDELAHADPTLDDDVAAWFDPDGPLPKLRLLGPVKATGHGTAPRGREPYMTELLAFIALRGGATSAEIAEAFHITTGSARAYALTVRNWLGTNPRTGQPHLPEARKTDAAAARGIPTYQVQDLLVDADLFRRLRVRGQARGADGISDLQTALRLVEGRPFDYPVDRETVGWAWLINGQRLDESLVVAVVDVAHTVTTHALATGDLAVARAAAETAALAAPHEEIPRLDLAAVAAAEGRPSEAQRIVRDQVCNRSDDDGAPPELSERTQEVLSQRKDWRDHRAS